MCTHALCLGVAWLKCVRAPMQQQDAVGGTSKTLLLVTVPQDAAVDSGTLAYDGCAGCGG